jgi:glucosamine kinase
VSHDARTTPPALYLGVDGGGSKTLAIIVDAAGHECGRGIAGSSNHEAVGPEQAVAALQAAVAAASAAARVTVPVRAAWLGLAGIDRRRDIEMLLPRVSAFASAVRLTNDAELLLGALPHRIGAAVIAGTGSIALGRNEMGATVRAGGWGHVLGDEGSGYGIGREALQATVRAADGRGPATTLLTSILNAWNLTEPESLMEHVYQPFDKTTIASLAPLVLASAAAGDLISRRIVAHAARELALAVSTVAHALGFRRDHLPLAVGGGLLVHQPRLRAQVLRRIASQWTIDHVIVEEPALHAAMMLAAENTPARS